MDHGVVSLFMCGTDENRNQNLNVVPLTFNATEGDRKFIVDGAGARASMGTDEQDIHVPKLARIQRKAAKGKGVDEANFNRRHNYGGATARGRGALDNVLIALNWLFEEAYKPQKPPITTINLCGWSRGAVSCVMLAQSIEMGLTSIIPDVQVNIFAIDPVAGGPGAGAFNPFASRKRKGTFEQTGITGHQSKLANCVNEYHAVLAENIAPPRTRSSAVSRRNSGATAAAATPSRKRRFPAPMPTSRSRVASRARSRPRSATSSCPSTAHRSCRPRS